MNNKCNFCIPINETDGLTRARIYGLWVDDYYFTTGQIRQLLKDLLRAQKFFEKKV